MPSKTTKQTKSPQLAAPPTDTDTAESKKTTKTKSIIDAFNAPKKLARKQAELEQLHSPTTRLKRTEPDPELDALTEASTPPSPPLSTPAKRGRGRPPKSAQGAKRPETVVALQSAQKTSAPVQPDPNLKTYRIDLHIHTPASHDYEQMDKTYLDILQKAERRGLNMIAFTDHNSANGFRNMQREISDLELLERLERIRPDELARLEEFRRLLKKIVVLPGFEFTATFGFHILGIFPSDKPLREIENVLVQLRVPNIAIDMGLTEAGATSDVLTAYRLIDEAGGIAIAAHANSSNGVSMRGLNLGGQTRIAFTQDPHLHAIEFTDLDRGKRSSAMLFKGTRAEYSRVMHVLQGSDAHRITADPKNPKRLGVGERPTEVDLPELSFNALRNLFLSDAFARVRPVGPIEVKEKEDSLQLARISGESAGVAFHAMLPKKGARFDEVLRDVCAMANISGGYIYLGCEPGTRKKVAGIAEANSVASQLSEAILQQVQPSPTVVVNVHEADGKDVIAIKVNASDKAPFVLNNEFLVRDGAATRVATRDEIVAIVRRVLEAGLTAQQRPNQPQPRNEQRERNDGTNRTERVERVERFDRNERADRADRNDRNARQQTGRQPNSNSNRPQAQSERSERFDRQPRSDRNEPRPTQGQQRPPQPNQQQRRPPLPRTAPSDLTPVDVPETAPVQPPQQASSRTSFVEQLQQAQAAIADRSPRNSPPQQAASNTASNTASPGEAKWEGQPRNGVQVTSMEERDGMVYFTVRDVRNNTTVRNVTMKSARDLWLYAVSQYAEAPSGPEGLDWSNNKAVVSKAMRAGRMRYDLAMRDAQGNVRVFFGVTDDGLSDEWRQLVVAYGEPDSADGIHDNGGPKDIGNRKRVDPLGLEELADDDDDGEFDDLDELADGEDDSEDLDEDSDDGDDDVDDIEMN